MKNMQEFHANKQKVMLVDGDLLAYKITSALEEVVDWGDDVFTLWSDLKKGKAIWKQQISYYQNYTNSKNVIICFSDKNNFRKELDKGYKSYRKNIRKPICYKPLRDWICKNYQHVVMENLEGDDVLGILATGVYKSNNVIVSGDKDVRTISTWHCFIMDDSIEYVDSLKADYNFCTQVLCGDSTDGYKGLVGCGAVKASRVLLDKKSIDELWLAVIQEYERNKSTAEEAYHQASLARILRNGEYDLHTHKPKLWDYKFEVYTKKKVVNG